MLRALVQIVLNGIAILLVAKVVPGIHYQGDIWYLLLTGLVVGGINLLVRPLVVLLSLPFIVLTLGLFFMVINGALLYLASFILNGLTIDGCFPALLGGLVMALFNWVIRALSSD